MKKPLILIADANPRILRFLSTEFFDAGFDVYCAGNADEVIQKMNAHPAPCLLVLDPDLPFSGGKTVMGKIVSREPKIPVIVYSPYDEYEKAPVYRSADAFVEKIANPVTLINAVKKLLHIESL